MLTVRKSQYQTLADLAYNKRLVSFIIADECVKALVRCGYCVNFFILTAGVVYTSSFSFANRKSDRLGN